MLHQIFRHGVLRNERAVLATNESISLCAPILMKKQIIESDSEVLTALGPLSDVTARTLNAAVLSCTVEEEGDPPKSKRVCLSSLQHNSFPQEPPPRVDRLQRLYPHPRDKDCYMDEKLHKYYVRGEPYSLSVSGWWKMFFEEFDPEHTSKNIVQRHLSTPGFRSFAADLSTLDRIPEGILASSVYNLAQHVRVLEKRGDDEFLKALGDVAMIAAEDYARRCSQVPFSVDHLMDLGRRCVKMPGKPEGPSCYYLMVLYTGACSPEEQAAMLAQTWHVHGQLESLKGTYLHKKIELFINAMAGPMERKGVLHMSVEELLREPPAAEEYSAVAVMQEIAWAIEPELWNHPITKKFLQAELIAESEEFCKFRSWLSTKLRWSPFRVEWSLFNEDLKVAGQLDSLWFDLDGDGRLVMADWKRARLLLTNDLATLERQAFGKMGVSCCAHLYDTAWSHYFVQQTLYVYMLALKYGLAVSKMILVQCHPDVCGSNFNEAPMIPDFALAESLAAFLRDRLEDTSTPARELESDPWKACRDMEKNIR